MLISFFEYSYKKSNFTLKGYLRSSLCLVLVFVPSLYDEILAIIIAYYRFKHRHTISEIEFCIEKSLLCIRCWTKLIFDIKLKYWSKKRNYFFSRTFMNYFSWNFVFWFITTILSNFVICLPTKCFIVRYFEYHCNFFLFI